MKSFFITKINEPMTHRNLSAGERQIFVMSILYGLLQVSERKNTSSL